MCVVCAERDGRRAQGFVFCGGFCIGLMKHFGAEVACWAHNPKVVGSRPTSAMFSSSELFFLLISFVWWAANGSAVVLYDGDDGKRVGSCEVVPVMSR